MSSNRSFKICHKFLIEASQSTSMRQECIPVGCVPSVTEAISPATHGPLQHTYLPCHACPCHACHACPPPLWTDRHLWNITFPQPLRTVKICLEAYILLQNKIARLYLGRAYLHWNFSSVSDIHRFSNSNSVLTMYSVALNKESIWLKTHRSPVLFPLQLTTFLPEFLVMPDVSLKY